ncbi:NADH-quinone oxidoreductase subunit A [Algivirga pacifica]|uniref:NADH-quinone oxidoreductase subunit A n=1 Tax=Algivirga pacifica TaxID=1162670 RepID=A0ABP9D621_9BACT
MLTDFAFLLLFLLGGAGFVLMTFTVSRLLRPDRPNEEKVTTYESGEDPIGSAWGRFNIRFYVIALVFLLFEVEIAFLFPWATVFGQEKLIEETNGLWGWFALAEVFIFVLILILGLAYVWKKGFLDWVKPEQKQSDYQSKIPASAYKKFME